MIRTLIIEDEQSCSEQLHRLLKNYANKIQIVGEFSSVESAIQGIQQLNPDLIFMDVEIKGGDCFDILKEITHPTFEIIFTTAHDKYAIQAIKYSALDYLLKPLDSFDLGKSIERALNAYEAFKTNKQLETMIQNMMVRGFQEKTLVLPSTNGLKFLKSGEIIRIESEASYCKMYTFTEGSFMVYKSIKYYEDLLDSNIFFRVHRSHMINISFVREYLDRTQTIVLSNEEKIPLSVRKKKVFFKLLEDNGQF